MTTFHDLAQKYADDSPGDAAAKILRELKITNPAFSILMPVVVNAVRTLNRAEVRVLERAAHGINLPPSAPPETQHEARIALMAERFMTRTWGAVEWGKATVAQHEERIAILTRIRKGVDTTIRLHRDAIAKINASGCTCLDEVK